MSDCNCTLFPDTGTVPLQQNNEQNNEENQAIQYAQVDLSDGSDSGENNDDDKEDQTDEDEEVELCSEKISLKDRSSYHDSFQDTLSECKEQLQSQVKPDLRFFHESDNIRDNNDIVVQAFIGSWRPIGYIPVPKVPKCTDAMRENEIVSVTLLNVFYRFVYGLGEHRFFSAISATKRHMWLPNRDTSVIMAIFE